MSQIDNAFCPKKDCKDYGLANHGNIARTDLSSTPVDLRCSGCARVRLCA